MLMHVIYKNLINFKKILEYKHNILHLLKLDIL